MESILESSPESTKFYAKNLALAYPSENTPQASTTCQHEYSDYSWKYSRSFHMYEYCSCTLMNTHISFSLQADSYAIMSVLNIVLVFIFLQNL